MISFSTLVLTSALTVVMTTQQAIAQTPVPGLPRSVTVSGTCLRSSSPDRGAVVLVSSVLAPELQKASRDAMEQYEQTKKAVQKLNLKNLELITSETAFFEEKEWQKDRQVSKGFRARMGLRVATSETSRLGEVIALATKSGIREIGSLELFLAPETLKLVREACLEEAVKNARSKAETIARAANAKVGKVLFVDEERGQSRRPPGPYPMRGQQMSLKASPEMDAAPSIDAGQEKISVEITASFYLE